LRHEIGLHRDGRIDGDGRAVRAHGHARHAFDAAGDIGRAGPAADLVRREVDRLHSARAEAVDREARDALVEPGGEDGGPGETAALFGDLRGIAPDHVLHGMALEAVAVLDRVQHVGRQAGRGHLVEAAVGLALAAGAADGVIDIGIGHGVAPFGEGGVGVLHPHAPAEYLYQDEERRLRAINLGAV